MDVQSANRKFKSPARWLLAGLGLMVLLGGRAQADDLTGEQIYKSHCVRCHGPTGAGTDQVKRALSGDKSIAQLARLIHETMPEDDPGLISSTDAEKVARYIHGAFYSPIAQARLRPARIELARLTVRQYQMALADLFGSFRSTGKWDAERGLRGEYFEGKRMQDRNRFADRRDPEVNFDFGTKSPDEKKPDAPDFSIRWTGSVLAPATGEYEFIVRTEHAARLWVNDVQRPLIDAWVKSGTDTEFRASIPLIAGRIYPIKLEFSKATQGVEPDDKKERKPPPPTPASIKLEWKPPHGVAQTIPARLLAPHRWPESYVVTTAFPPDDRRDGYERGTTISKAWDEATTEAAIDASGYLIAHLRELSGVGESDPDRAAKLKAFCETWVTRAFRHPLSEDQKQLYIERPWADTPDLETAVKRVALVTLKSPRFLYREVGRTQSDPYDTASRLSFTLWDSLPDAALLDAARDGKLKTADELQAQAERMLSDPRALAKLRGFVRQWLNIDDVPEIAKDRERFPGFDEQLLADLRASLDQAIEDILTSPEADFRQLLQTEEVYLNGRLAAFFGVELPADAPFQKCKLEPEARSGLLTHPYVLARYAYTAESSPIHRGVFLARSVLGRVLMPPPEAVAPLPAELHAGMTTRERVIKQTDPVACQTCHAMINPLGFALEEFDAVGRLRKEEQGKPIDPSGYYQPLQGETVKFRGARELASYLVSSGEVHHAFLEQLFQYLVKQPIQAYGPDTSAALLARFQGDGYSIRKLALAIAVRAATAEPDQVAVSMSNR
jgi:mono/diheme cytochrome c family protein